MAGESWTRDAKNPLMSSVQRWFPLSFCTFVGLAQLCKKPSNPVFTLVSLVFLHFFRPCTVVQETMQPSFHAGFTCLFALFLAMHSCARNHATQLSRWFHLSFCTFFGLCTVLQETSVNHFVHVLHCLCSVQTCSS